MDTEGMSFDATPNPTRVDRRRHSPRYRRCCPQVQLEAVGSGDGLTVTVWGVLPEGVDTLTMTPVKVTGVNVA